MDNYVNNFLFTYFPYIATDNIRFGFILRLVMMNKSVRQVIAVYCRQESQAGKQSFSRGHYLCLFGHLTFYSRVDLSLGDDHRNQR